MLELDGSQGEGGGQILRTALSLSLCLGKPFRIFNIRSNRDRPGLQPQHLMAVQAAARISSAMTEGAIRGSSDLLFAPRHLQCGDFEFDIGTAGSTNLVLQTLLPAFMTADAPSRLVIRGGTHNPLAPPFEFLRDAFIPLLNRAGADVETSLERYGFYPRGGGVITAQIRPRRVQPLRLMQRGRVLRRRATALLSRLPEHIARRELDVLKSMLGLAEAETAIEQVKALSSANVLLFTLECEHVTEVFSAMGKRGLPAEQVAGMLVEEIRRYLDADAPVGVHLADQLLLPMALAGGGCFRTLSPSLHTRTNIGVINQFMGLAIDVKRQGENDWVISLA